MNTDQGICFLPSMDQISINKIIEEKWKQEKAEIEEERKLTETEIREEWKFTEARMEEKLRMARLRFKKKLKQTEKRIRTEIMMNQRISTEKSMKLQFMNKISQPILTGEELKGEGNTSIEVLLVNNSTGNIVDVGPESSASVDIVVLKKDFDEFDRDDWTVEEFNEKIVHPVQGKKPLLEENVRVKLFRGRGVLGKIKFKHHVTKMKPRPEFRLGARLNGDLSNEIFVKEAKTESFIVKNFRKKYSMKHEIPSLSDKVWRLHNIGKGGKIGERLQSEGIYDVEGLLIRFLKDPQGLKNVVGLCLTKWEAIVKHARMCPSGDRRYCYIDSQQKTGIVFDILGQVLGLYSKGQCSSAINMPGNKASADELLSSAINHWGDVVPFDDENSVNQYFTRIMSVDDSNPPGSQYHGHGSTEETPIISNSSNQGIISNSSREIGLKDSANCPLSIDDMEIVHDSPCSPCSNLDLDTMFPGFDGEFSLDNCVMQRYKDFVEATNVESTGILFVAPSEVAIPICKAPKRYWRKLSHASRLFCVRKKKIAGSSEGNNQAQKKQKIFEACARKI